jgi:CRISPR-associated endonuclease/helicase Cas3
MTYYSHSKTLENGDIIGAKTIKLHLENVLNNVHNLLAPNVNFGIDNELFNKLIEKTVQYHDFGKYTSYFQNYLFKNGKVDSVLKQHARIGGIISYNILKPKNQKVALLSLYIIFRHHSFLCDFNKFTGAFNDELSHIFQKQAEDITKNIDSIQSELNENDLRKFLTYPVPRDLRRGFKIWSKKEPDIKYYFLINYLFSLLIEADKLDASGTEIYNLREISPERIDKRFGKPHISESEDLTKLSNNEIRNFCRAEIVENIKRDDILEHHIFTLTAPTGIGKTMSALDFSLKMKHLIKSVNGLHSRIIYSLPFINIIEQALNEYKETLPGNIKILGHYQYADIFGDQKLSSEEKNYNQKLMTLDTWQGDIVITSFVQFFETLIGNKNKLLKKFNHFANAIVILDEVQTIRLDQMPLIGAALFYLSKYLNTRIILMTATKPKIFELAQSEILTHEDEIIEPYELLKSHKRIFSHFSRTKIIPLLSALNEVEDKINHFVTKVFLDKWNKNKSCLIVVNTVNRSINLHNEIEKHFSSNNIKNPIHYLSTNIIPCERKKRIENIKRDIKNGISPVVVSTQVVEAGVDLDFDIGFRDLGPIDSIIQVAGRVNRNNNPDKQHSPIYVVNFGDCQKIYGQITSSQAIKALSEKNVFLEEEYYELIDKYFDEISSRKSFEKYNQIFNSMKHLRYEAEDDDNEHPVSSFKIIEESKNTIPVFIEIDNSSRILREKYKEQITGLISKEEFDKNYKLLFNQHIIAVPNYLTNNLPPLNEYEESIQLVPMEMINEYYEKNTGFIRKQTSSSVML